MLRHILVVAALAFVTGCSADMAVRNPFNGEERTQKAAFAASAQYPDNVQASQESDVVALLDRKDDTIRIINPTDQPMRDVRVWVNGSYVQRVDVVPAHGSVQLKASDFYSQQGNRLTDFDTAPNRVEIQQDDELFSVQMSFM